MFIKKKITLVHARNTNWGYFLKTNKNKKRDLDTLETDLKF